MADDGTTGSGFTPPEQTARQVVELYHRNLHSTATTFDVWTVGDALLRRTEEVDERVTEVEEELTDFEDETQTEFKTVEQRLDELEEIVSLLIFNLEDVGISINFEKLLQYKEEHLNL